MKRRSLFKGQFSNFVIRKFMICAAPKLQTILGTAKSFDQFNIWLFTNFPWLYKYPIILHLVKFVLFPPGHQSFWARFAKFQTTLSYLLMWYAVLVRLLFCQLSQPGLNSHTDLEPYFLSLSSSLWRFKIIAWRRRLH